MGQLKYILVGQMLKVGWKMTNGQLLFLALGARYLHAWFFEIAFM